MGPESVGISWLPLYHDMGLIGAWLTLLLHGVPLVVMSPLAFLTRPERWLQAISKHRGTITAAPNFAYELCVRKISDKAMEGVDLSSMRVMHERSGAGESGNAGALRAAIWEVWIPKRGDAAGLWTGGGIAGA